MNFSIDLTHTENNINEYYIIEKNNQKKKTHQRRISFFQLLPLCGKRRGGGGGGGRRRRRRGTPLTKLLLFLFQFWYLNVNNFVRVCLMLDNFFFQFFNFMLQGGNKFEFVFDLFLLEGEKDKKRQKKNCEKT